MIHRGCTCMWLLKCILTAQRPTVPTGPPGLNWTCMLTGERWRGREELNRTPGVGAEWSFLIPHFVLDPLESSRLNKYTLPQLSSLFKTPSPFVPHPSIPRPHRWPVTSTVFILFFLSLLCLFSKIKGSLSGAVNVCMHVCVLVVVFALASRTLMTWAPLCPAVSTLHQHLICTKATGPPHWVTPHMHAHTDVHILLTR